VAAQAGADARLDQPFLPAVPAERVRALPDPPDV
jgi:hypothetical protein